MFVYESTASSSTCLSLADDVIGTWLGEWIRLNEHPAVGIWKWELCQSFFYSPALLARLLLILRILIQTAEDGAKHRGSLETPDRHLKCGFLWHRSRLNLRWLWLGRLR